MDDLKKRLQDHFAKLGYSGEVPSSLVNPSTCSIWEQVIDKVKPKSEIDAIRKNLMIHKLASNGPPEVYNQMKDANSRLEKLRARLAEKQRKAASLQETNKSLYLANASMKEKLKENKLKIHALKLKNLAIQDETKQLESIVNEKGLQPISENANHSQESTMDKIQMLVEKIDPLVTKQIAENIQKQPTDVTQIYSSNAQTSVRACLSTTQKTKPHFSKMKSFKSCTNVNSARALFRQDFDNDDNHLEKINEIAPLNQSNNILPESCFNVGNDHSFLNPLRLPSVFQNEIDNNKKENRVESSLNLWEQSDYQSEEAKQKRDLVYNILSNKIIIQNVEEVFEGNNKTVIWSAICCLRKILLKNIQLNVECAKRKINFRSKDIDQEERFKLNYIFVKNCILAQKSKKHFFQLKNAFTRAKSNVELELGKIFVGDLPVDLELELESVKLDATIQFLRKEMSNNTMISNKTLLTSKHSEIRKAKQELSEKIKEIKEYMEGKKTLITMLKSCQYDTSTNIKKLAKFTFNPMWTKSLMENVIHKEIILSKDFPLYFKKQISLTHEGIMLLSNGITSISMDDCSDDNILFMITYLLGNPQNCFEWIAKDILKKENELQTLASLECSTVTMKQDYYDNYNFKDLQDQEDYVENECKTLISHGRSAKAYHILNAPNRMKTLMQLSLEMPFNDYISQSRVVDGKTYKMYEKERIALTILRK